MKFKPASKVNVIEIRGARTHNLKNINLELPKDKLVVITGLSGSGKSSLAFDTLYAEGQRRYVESLSAYARQFLAQMEKPDVDAIEGLSPAISIEQKTTSHNPRSTVGTVTEIYDYLRVLFARVGVPRCPEHGIDLDAQTVSQMVDAVLALPENSKVMLLAPVIRERKGENQKLFTEIKRQGFLRVRIDGEVYELDELPDLDAKKKHSVDVVVDRIKVVPDIRQRLAESFETALRLAHGLASIVILDDDKQNGEQLFSAKFACPKCGYNLSALEPRLFSFNNPVGACSGCDGLGVRQGFDESKVIRDEELSLAGGALHGWDRRSPYYFSMLSSVAEHYGFSVEVPFKTLTKSEREIVLYGNKHERIRIVYQFSKRRVTRKQSFEGVIRNMERRYQETESDTVREELAKFLSLTPCPDCHGERLNQEARHVFVGEKNLPAIAAMSVTDALNYFSKLNLIGARAAIGAKLLKEVTERLSFLANVGLEYLSLQRSAETLSGGEAQRIRLASQIGSGLTGVMYVLDEPTIGLHQRDNQRLLKTLKHLRDIGNTVIVVEHDAETILSADHVVDIGPAAGVHGGQIIFSGTAKDLVKDDASLTGQYLSGALTIETPKARVPFDKNRVLELTGVRQNNLQSIDVKIPLGLFTCVTGVSGSGKSSLVNDVLYPLAARHLNHSLIAEPTTYSEISGLENLDKVVDIDQSPIGRTPRSNPATYTGIFTLIRELFAETQEARARGYKAGRFSFNVAGGRCEACQGGGMVKVEMHFLPDMYVMCDVCNGKRYNEATLGVRYKGKTIAEVLDMTIEEALDFFAAIPRLAHKLQTLIEVGLSYITLGQSATTLSGGEAQRIKLSRELARRDTGNTLYILDEPTTGLHFHDVKQLLSVLHNLRDRGNTIVVIEHNLDVIKTADWLIDLGPEGGDRGGQVVAVGTPEDVKKGAKKSGSHTGEVLS